MLAPRHSCTYLGAGLGLTEAGSYPNPDQRQPTGGPNGRIYDETGDSYQTLGASAGPHGQPADILTSAEFGLECRDDRSPSSYLGGKIGQAWERPSPRITSIAQ